MTVVDSLTVPRILIAEADPWVRNMLTELVVSVRCDAHLEICADGQQAKEWLAHHQADLIIADWGLPGTDGLTLLHGVRQQRRQPAVPFILLSNRSDKASVREAVLQAPTAYLTKPLNMEGLRRRLEDLLLRSGEPVTCEVPALAPGLSLSHFLENHRDNSAGAPLSIDLRGAVAQSQGKEGLDIVALALALRMDPHVTAVLIAAANSATQHRGTPAQTLSQALHALGPTQSLNLINGLSAKRDAVLTDQRLLDQAQRFWAVSRLTAEYARSMARSRELDQERCFCAGLLHNLGDLAVLRCLQEWVSAGGELEEDDIQISLKNFGAAFGSTLRTRWRLPLELRQLIASVYHFGNGVHSREDLAMNIAGQLALLGPDDEVDALANSKPARLLKVAASELSKLRSM